MWATIINIYKRIKTYSPLRINFFIVLLLLIILQFIIKKIGLHNYSFNPMIYAMSKISLLFILILFLISLLAIFTSYVYLKYSIAKGKNAITLKWIATQHNTTYNILEINIKKYWIMIFGQLKGLLHFDNNITSSTFNAETTYSILNFGTIAFKSESRLILPYIQTYNVKKLTLIFRDMFGLVQMPLSISNNLNVINLPIINTDVQDVPEPIISEALLIRIQKQKRIDGDLLRYKKFDNADDIRRVVWKIFAKNKELIVRAPEIFNPFANDIILFTSFSNTILVNNTATGLAALSNYKQKVYDIYNALNQGAIGIKFKTDHNINTSDNTILQITKSIWHNIPLQDTLQPKTEIICISDGMHVNALSNLLQTAHKNSFVYLISSASVFKNTTTLNWIGKIFLLPNQNVALKSSWKNLVTKNILKRNNQKLIALLKAENTNYKELI
jgi:hypothetical protein